MNATTTTARNPYFFPDQIATLVTENEITFFTDPGHGWLRIPITLAKKIGLTGVSSYSYMDSTHLFLEEDCDITHFFNAIGMTQRAEQKPLFIAFWQNCKESYAENTPIRNKARFDLARYNHAKG